MKTWLTVALMALVVSPSAAFGDDVYSLIVNGRLTEAADSLARMTTAATRDGDVLYWQGLIEPNGEKAARLLEAALASGVSLSYRQDIYYRLAQYYLISNEITGLSRIVNEYRATWEVGRYEPEMMRFSAIVDQLQGDFESSLRQVDRFLMKYNDGDLAQWGTVDKARILRAHGKSIGADKMLKQLKREKAGVGVPQALYVLALDAIEAGATEDAVFYYNLLREGYPVAVGLDRLVEQLTALAQGYGGGSAAEELTGTYYAVKVGVFAEKDNAKRQARLFEKHSEHVTIGKKRISDRDYHVVYVGKFRTYQDAYRFKTTLETTYDEVYQVVAR